MVTNTSLNVKDQPICISIVDALSTFYSTGMDGIAIGNYLLLKKVLIFYSNILFPVVFNVCLHLFCISQMTNIIGGIYD